MRLAQIKMPMRVRLGIVVAAVFSGFLAASSAAEEAGAIDPEATKVLSEMSAYLSGLNSLSADFDTTTDVMTTNGQKIKLASSGNVILDRPGRIRVKRLGAFAEMDLIADGTTLTLYGMRINAYFQLPATTIDEAVERVRDDIGFEIPGADLIISNPLDSAITDVVSGIHVGMTTVATIPVHHLAFRGDQVDWQIWIKDGDEPLPIKYVITSKLLAGAPEFELLVTNWNTDPQFDDTTFTFSLPSGAKELTSLSFDSAGNIMDNAE